MFKIMFQKKQPKELPEEVLTIFLFISICACVYDLFSNTRRLSAMCKVPDYMMVWLQWSRGCQATNGEKLRPAGRFFRNRILPSSLPVGKYRRAISQSVSNSLRSRVLETLGVGSVQC